MPSTPRVFDEPEQQPNTRISVYRSRATASRDQILFLLDGIIAVGGGGGGGVNLSVHIIAANKRWSGFSRSRGVDAVYNTRARARTHLK